MGSGRRQLHKERKAGRARAAKAGLSEHGEDGLVFGRAAGRTRGPVLRHRRSFHAALGARKLGLVGGLLCDMLGSFSVATARRRRRSPAVAPLPAGQVPGWGPSSPYLGTATDA